MEAKEIIEFTKKNFPELWKDDREITMADLINVVNAYHSLPSVRAILNDGEIDHISKIQRFVCRCIGMFGPGTPDRPIETKKELMKRWAASLFEYESQIRFNEEVWLPSDEGARGNVVALIVQKDRTQTFTILNIDFRKGYHDCVTFTGGNPTGYVVDIFDVDFKMEVDDEEA